MIKYKLKAYQKIILIFTGITLTLVLLELSLRFASYLYVLRQDYYNYKSIQKKADYTILTLGESTTEMGGDFSWPRQLEEILQKRIPKHKFTVVNKARSGTNSNIILSELEGNLNKYNPDIVITMMGANDGTSLEFRVQDEALEINIEKSPGEKHLPFFIDELKIYKFLNLLRIRIQKKMKILNLFSASGLLVFAEGFNDTEYMFKETILKDPQNDKLYVDLGNWYISQNRNEDAIKQYLNALKINENNYEASVGLANGYKNDSENEKAELMYKKAILINPQNTHGHIKLGIHLIDLGRYDEAVREFLKVINIDPQNEEAYVQASIAYRYNNQYDQAKQIIEKASQIRPDSNYIKVELENIYRQMGNINKVNETSKRILGVSTTNTSNYINNYRKLKEIVVSRGILLIAVQYPTRNVESLKKIIGTDNVIFVDNEKVFKDALMKKKYDDLFIDRFMGDFGHATALGNNILASNIADTIIKAVFNKTNYKAN